MKDRNTYRTDRHQELKKLKTAEDLNRPTSWKARRQNMRFWEQEETGTEKLKLNKVTEGLNACNNIIHQDNNFSYLRCDVSHHYDIDIS